LSDDDADLVELPDRACLKRKQRSAGSSDVDEAAYRDIAGNFAVLVLVPNVQVIDQDRVRVGTPVSHQTRMRQPNQEDGTRRWVRRRGHTRAFDKNKTPELKKCVLLIGSAYFLQVGLIGVNFSRDA
jgi:hypothetical protein